MGKRFDKSCLVNIAKSDAISSNGCLKEYLGKPIAVLCQKYVYRGILAKVNDDSIILSKAKQVETSGASKGSAPEKEENCGDSLMVWIRSIELVFQPNWCLAPLD